MPLAGVQTHIEAVAAGESLARRHTLINGSNYLSDHARLTQGYFLNAFCLAAALEQFCGGIVELGGGLTLHLNKPRAQLTGNELPGVRVDGDGWLVIEGQFYKQGKPCARYHRGLPLWPLMYRIPAVEHPAADHWQNLSGPWENFRPQILKMLREEGEQWPRQTLTA